VSKCRTQRYSSDPSTDTVAAVTAVFFVDAHVFVIDRASLLIGGNGYLGIELLFPEIITVGFSKLARAGFRWSNKGLSARKRSNNQVGVCIWTAMTNRGHRPRSGAGGKPSISLNGNARGDKGRAQNSARQVGVFCSYLRYGTGR